MQGQFRILTGVGANVDRIFKVSGLYKIVEKYDAEEEAFIRPAKEGLVGGYQ